MNLGGPTATGLADGLGSDVQGQRTRTIAGGPSRWIRRPSASTSRQHYAEDPVGPSLLAAARRWRLWGRSRASSAAGIAEEVGVERRLRQELPRIGASIGSVIWISTADTGSLPWGDMKDMSARPTTAMVRAHTRIWMNLWRKSIQLSAQRLRLLVRCRYRLDDHSLERALLQRQQRLRRRAARRRHHVL